MRDYYIYDTTAKKWSAELKYTGKSVYSTCDETLKIEERGLDREFGKRILECILETKLIKYTRKIDKGK